MVASRGEGREALLATLVTLLDNPPTPPAPLAYDDVVERDIREVESAVAQTLGVATAAACRARATWALLSIDATDELVGVPQALRTATRTVQTRAEAAGRNLDLGASRYRRIDRLVRRSTGGAAPGGGRSGSTRC